MAPVSRVLDEPEEALSCNTVIQCIFIIFCFRWSA